MKFGYFEGIQELQDALKERAKMEDVKKIIQHDGAQMQGEMQRNAIFKKGYSQGDTQRSISLLIYDGGLAVAVEPHTEYSPYVEYGTRYMEAQPFVRPTFIHMRAIFKGHMMRLFM